MGLELIQKADTVDTSRLGKVDLPKDIRKALFSFLNMVNSKSHSTLNILITDCIVGFDDILT